MSFHLFEFGCNDSGQESGAEGREREKKMRTSHGDIQATVNQSEINIHQLLKLFFMKHGALRSVFDSRKTGSRPKGSVN